MVESGRLLTCCTGQTVPWVRIPLSLGQRSQGTSAWCWLGGSVKGLAKTLMVVQEIVVFSKNEQDAMVAERFRHASAKRVYADSTSAHGSRFSEEWLSGLKRRFGKPVYGESRTVDSNSTSSAKR